MGQVANRHLDRGQGQAVLNPASLALDHLGRNMPLNLVWLLPTHGLSHLRAPLPIRPISAPNGNVVTIQISITFERLE